MGIQTAAVFALALFGFGGANVNFDDVPPSAVPAGWTLVERPGATTAHWEVLREMSAPSRPNVFAQTATHVERNEFPLAIYDAVSARDLDLSVKFRISSQGPSRRVGLIWRYQDENNYYLLRFSSDDKQIELFRVLNGQAQHIPIPGVKPATAGVAHDVRVDQWYVTKITVRGSRIRVLFGNRFLFEVDDDTIAKTGKTGLWTRGGTIAWFDDFRVDRKG